MRGHPEKNKFYLGYSDFTPEAQALIAFQPNTDIAERERCRGRCHIVAERGIDVGKLPNFSDIPRWIDEQQWHGFVAMPKSYDEELVWEFYRNMRPGAFKDHKVVVVRGNPVIISPDSINQYLGTRNDLEQRFNMTYGFLDDERFTSRYNYLIARSLRTSGDSNWDTSANVINKCDLYADLAFMVLFIKASLMPSSHANTIDDRVAKVLYSLKHNLPLDVGHLIWLEIVDAGDSLKGTLPFPCLITHFCQQANILPGILKSPKKNLSEGNYATQLRTTGTEIPMPMPQPLRRGRSQAARHDPPPPPQQPPPQQQPQQQAGPEMDPRDPYHPDFQPHRFGTDVPYYFQDQMNWWASHLSYEHRWHEGQYQGLNQEVQRQGSYVQDQLEGVMAVMRQFGMDTSGIPPRYQPSSAPPPSSSHQPSSSRQPSPPPESSTRRRSRPEILDPSPTPAPTRGRRR